MRLNTVEYDLDWAEYDLDWAKNLRGRFVEATKLGSTSAVLYSVRREAGSGGKVRWPGLSLESANARARGTNYMLFDPFVAVVKEVHRYTVRSVRYRYQPTEGGGIRET